MKNKLILILLSLMIISSRAVASQQQGPFWQKRYQGWYWFEDSKKQPKDLSVTNRVGNITPEQARAEIEQFAKELEELKYLMLARPSVENVRNYREKEKEMWVRAEKLHDAWDMANLLYPEQRDLINNPVNVHAVKIKRQLEVSSREEKIKELAGKYDLVLFFSQTCTYCQLLSPVLKSFADKYGFTVEAVSSENNDHEYFVTKNVIGLVEKLGISAFPTVIAISHDGRVAFELIRGYVSLAELEEYSLLAYKYLQEQKP